MNAKPPRDGRCRIAPRAVAPSGAVFLFPAAVGTLWPEFDRSSTALQSSIRGSTSEFSAMLDGVNVNTRANGARFFRILGSSDSKVTTGRGENPSGSHQIRLRVLDPL